MTDALQKKNHFIILFEFYKELLTPKQKEFFVYYYEDDYSLQEIATSFEISRNAVWTSLQKVEILLDEYEEKLKLVSKFEKKKKLYSSLQNHTDEEGKKIIISLLEME